MARSVRFLRFLPAIFLILGAFVSLAPVAPALAAPPYPCPASESQLQSDMSGGGTVILSCSSDTTIHFDTAGGGTGAPITVSTSVTLDASSSPGTITLDGGGTTQLFIVNSSVTFGLTSLTLQNGYTTCSGRCSATGGAINSQGKLIVTNSTFSDNTTTCSSGSSIGCEDASGAIAALGGSLNITGSTFTKNSVSCDGDGCLAYGGALNSPSGGATITVTNSTITGNTASCTDTASSCFAQAGAIYAPFSGTTVTVTNSTVTGNSASCTGPSCYAGAGGTVAAGGGAVAFGGSIIADNTNGNCAVFNTGSTLTDLGYNLDTDGTCTSGQTGDITGKDPKLGSLADNGGPTQTMALQSDSPAIDQIPTTYDIPGTTTPLCPSQDQRGDTRPDNSEGNCDIGAYEASYDETTTTLSTSGSPSTVGQSVTYTATVAPISPFTGTPSGTVTFYLFAPGVTPNGTDSNNVYSDTVTVIGNGTYTTSQGTNPGGYASTKTGTYQWVAVYSGDANNNGVTSAFGDEPVTVSPAHTTTTLTSSQNPSTSGQSVTFTAAITVTSPGSGTPTGTVTFQDNGSDIQTCSSRMVSTSTETATCTTSTLSAGVHTITAIYSGNTNFIGSTGTLQQDVSTTVPNGKSAYDIESSNWYCNAGGITCLPSSDRDASACVTMTPCPGASYGDVEAFGPPNGSSNGVPDEMILACVQGTNSGYTIGYVDVLSSQGNADYPGGIYGTADPGVISGKGNLIGGGGLEDNSSQPGSVSASAYDSSTGIIGSVTGIQNTDNQEGADTLNSGGFRVTIRGRLWTVTNGHPPVRNSTSSTMSCTVGGTQGYALFNARLDTTALAEGELEPTLGDNFFLPTIAPAPTT